MVSGDRRFAGNRPTTAGASPVLALGNVWAIRIAEQGVSRAARGDLDATACSEVINAAVAGLNLRGIRVLWERWASRFKPRAVLIYPTPAFYLANNPPAAPGPARAVQPAPVYRPPRLLLRAKERFELPRFVRQRIVERELDELLRAAGKPFDDVPADWAAQFDSDLEALIVSIVSSGATPVLVTHATGFRGEPSVDEHDELQALRRFAPRATPRVLLAFERRTAEGVRRAAKKHGCAWSTWRP